MDDILLYLETLIHDRRQNPREGSYTHKLLQSGRNKIAQKVGEEAVEVVIAALGEGRQEQVGELADLLFHTLVLMAELDISLATVQQELRRRHLERQ